MGFGTSELIIVLVIVIVVFGSTKLPQLGDGLGRAIKNFKRAVSPGNELDVSPKKPELKGEAANTGSETSGSEKTTAAK